MTGVTVTGVAVPGVTVVIDFGSSHTVAVLRTPTRPATVVGEPSVVLLSAEEQLVAGSEALRLSSADSSRALTRLTARLDQRETLVGDTVLPVVALVRALFARVTLGVAGPIDELVLTHPAGWPSARVAVLSRAAAGLAARVTTVPAPVAAAAGADLEPGAAILVVDFGAATCEAAVVRRARPGYTVLAHGSLDLGGDDLDTRVGDRLGVSAGTAQELKEQLVRTGSAGGLGVAEFDRLVAGDVARVVELVDRVVGAAPVEQVLLVGGSSRIPLVGRRIAEVVPRPVRLATDPEAAVAWGALRAVDEPAPAEPATTTPATATTTAAAPAAGTSSAAEPVRPLRPVRRRLAVGLGGLVLVAAVAAVAVVGIRPGQLTAGLPGPAEQPPSSAASVVALPPEVAGTELVGRGRPAFAAAELGTPARYRHPSGTTLEVTLNGVQTQRAAPPPVEEAPVGYRWLAVFLGGRNVAGPAWRPDLGREVAALDDRGQWVQPLGAGGAPCEPGTALPAAVEPGAVFDTCVLIPVPAATPVVAVVFGVAGTPEPPLRVPVSVAAATDTPVPARVVGRLGDPAVEVTVDGAVVRAGADVVLTPSGYLPDRRPAAGNRLVVVRAQLPATGAVERVYLRDDRGVLTAPLTGFDTMPDCPPFAAPGAPEQVVYACFVYELAAATPIAGVTLGRPLTGAGREVEQWPTWLAD